MKLRINPTFDLEKFHMLVYAYRHMKYLLIALVLVSFALMTIPAIAEKTVSAKGAAGTAETKGTSSTPIKDIIDKTPSIKEMQSKPARGQSYRFDILGNEVATQTDNSGKRAR